MKNTMNIYDSFNSLWEMFTETQMKKGKMFGFNSLWEMFTAQFANYTEMMECFNSLWEMFTKETLAIERAVVCRFNSLWEMFTAPATISNGFILGKRFNSLWEMFTGGKRDEHKRYKSFNSLWEMFTLMVFATDIAELFQFPMGNVYNNILLLTTILPQYVLCVKQNLDFFKKQIISFLFSIKHIKLL